MTAIKIKDKILAWSEEAAMKEQCAGAPILIGYYWLLRNASSSIGASVTMSCVCAFSPVTVTTVKDTWSDIKVKVGDNGDLTVTMLIFEIFFREHPSSIKYFKRFGTDALTIMENKVFIKHGRKNVFQTFDQIISVLDKPDELTHLSEWIGKVHKMRNISNEDYQNLGDSIVKAVKQALGEQCTVEVEKAWRTVLVAFMSTIAAFSSK